MKSRRDTRTLYTPVCYNIAQLRGRSEMTIERYSFGSITINGRTYTSDVIIYPDRVNASWWRKEGHNLNIVDLTDVLNAKPDVLLVGTGSSGLMKVSKETLSYLESKGIKVHVSLTAQSVDLFNKLQSEKKVIAAFHLTC